MTDRREEQWRDEQQQEEEGAEGERDLCLMMFSEDVIRPTPL